MKINYIISILFLFISFLLYKKNANKVSIVSQVIYILCFIFCEQLLMVLVLSFFGLGGSLLIYSIFQYVIGSILFLISYHRKRIQEYYFDKMEFLSVILILCILFIVVWVRFDGFNSISYGSDDSSVHYKTALVFSRKLEKLNGSSHVDLIHGDFTRMIPISYINGGFLINIFSCFSSVRIFLIYDSICFIMYVLLFFETIFNKKRYFFSIVISLLYGFSYPLNNLIFGFCYLGLGVMVVNLLYYTIKYIDFSSNKFLVSNILILFLLCFSLFYSYYLFVPVIYLSLGIYYIMLWKRKIISFQKMFLYGFITLIIPFLIGFIRFILPIFYSTTGVLKIMQLDGDIYYNLLPVYFFLLFSVYFIYEKIHINNEKISYFSLTFYILSFYVLIFFVLRIFGIGGYYYFYKLFYVYFLFVFIYVSSRLYIKRKVIYLFSIIMILGCLIVGMFPRSHVSSFLERITIYQYNVRKFARDMVRFTSNELKIVDMASKYKKKCEYHHEFLLVGRNSKNMWFYEITGSIPVLNHSTKNREQFYYPNINFYIWEKNVQYPCVVVFYEDRDISYDFSNYDILYSNYDGAIVRRKT